jgi:hypothetical protein
MYEVGIAATRAGVRGSASSSEKLINGRAKDYLGPNELKGQADATGLSNWKLASSCRVTSEGAEDGACLIIRHLTLITGTGLTSQQAN